MLASSAAGVGGSSRSDLKDSKSSAVGAGALASKDVPLEYTLTLGGPELQAKLAAAGDGTPALDAQMSLGQGVRTIPEAEGEDQVSPQQEAGKDIDTVAIEVVDQDSLRQPAVSEAMVLAAGAGLAPMNRDITSLMTVSNASEQEGAAGLAR